MAETIRRPRSAFDLPGLFALALYFVLAALFFARGLEGRWSTAYIGKGVDPQLLMWLVAWWPHALSHGLNPLYTRAAWAPDGVNLAWSTCMPLVSLPAVPLVLTMGPVFTYNLACVVAVGLAAWCAFILCRHLSGEYWAALAGGYVFGFSAYMLGQTAAHLDLILTFPIPLFALLLIRGLRADLAWRALVGGLVLVLVAQFLLFVELFATMTLFAGIGLIVVLVAGSSAEKTRAVNLLPSVALSYAIALAAVSPFLYYMIASGYEPGAPHPPLLYSTDLLNLVIPTSTMELGRAAPLRSIAAHFPGNIFEAGGYIGIPLMLLAAAFARRHWSEGWARAIVFVLIVAVVLSLGPFLVVGGRPIIPLPGLAVGTLPLIGKALPARLMLYAFLALAIITAQWLSDGVTSRWVRVAAALAVLASMLPNLSAGFWTSAIGVPAFFSDALYAKYLSPGETVVVLPYGNAGDSMLWQLESGWYFRMAGGNLGPPPLKFRQWPIVRVFYRAGTVELPGAGDQLKAFLAAHRATAVVVDDREAGVWRPLMATLGAAPIEAGGMTIYREPPAELALWQNATALAMETHLDRARFAALVLAAESYLRDGHPLTALTPAEVYKLRLMPAGWIVVPKKAEPPWDDGGMNLPRHPHDPRQFDDLWLGADEQGRIEVGVAGWYPALRAVLSEYRADAIGFVPRDLDQPARGGEDDLRGWLVMSFSAEGLARAASRARDDGSSAAAEATSR
ncbi:MAG TPA: hypothetical protein VNF28_00495 [Candidatus Binataceae bacterium]|nr:hypothetical protein [Candidatus Binataceae bacterium]